jgi:drug/metabolite transporter (DMT)-like permease
LMDAKIGILFAITAMLSWGVGDFLAKKAIDKIGYAKSMMINLLASFGPILIYAILFPRIPAMSIELVLLVVVTAVFSAIGYFYFYKGLEKGNVSVVSPISSSWAVVTTSLATVIFKEVLTSFQVVGIMIVFVGIFLASTNLRELRKSISHGMSNGASEAIIAMIGWGITFALAKPLVDMTGPAMTLLFMRGGSFLFVFSWTRIVGTRLTIPERSITLFLIVSGLLDTLGFLAYNLGVTTAFVSIVSPIAATFPAVTIVLAYIFLKERVVNSQKVGIVAILAGLILISLV